MARIRSVHPELFTDEGFCALSPQARLLYIGIWTQCDDQGVFEWKPFGLKISLCPVDNVSVETLLGELVENQQVRKYDVGEKSYGAVRNFCRYQRPKKLRDIHPILSEVSPYVALELRKDLPEVPKRTPKGEKSAHRRGEERREGKRENSKTTTEQVERESPGKVEVPPPAAPDSLSNFSEKVLKEAKPAGLKALGTQLPADWTPDDALCDQVKRDFGLTDDDLRSELLGFHADHATKGTFSQSWRASFVTWCKRWREQRDKQAPQRLELSKSPTKRREDDWPPDYLEQFWAFYPPGRKTGKKAVGARLDVIRRRGDVTFNRLMAGLQRYVDSRPDPQYTKAPEVWLNKGCWDDELVFKGAPDGKTQTAVDPSKLGFAGFAALGRATAPVERPVPEDIEPFN